jgi:lysophospholipase L1-like esterase
MNRVVVAAAVAALAVTAVLSAPALLKPATATTPAALSATIVPRKSLPASPTPAPTAAPIVLMSVGDSLTEGHGPGGTITQSYRPELSRLLRLAGVPHTWNVQAIGGTTCAYWAAHLPALLDTYHPALIFLDCGTNDTPSNSTEADYRTILAAAAARNIPIVAALIGVPDMKSPTNTVRPWIIDWMHGTNLAIQRALASYPSVPVANMWRVPPNKEWLQDDGIHLTARSEAAYAQIFYQAAQAMRGWPSLAQMGTHEMCGLSGVFTDTDPWPAPDVAYRVCRSD